MQASLGHSIMTSRRLSPSAASSCAAHIVSSHTVPSHQQPCIQECCAVASWPVRQWSRACVMLTRLRTRVWNQRVLEPHCWHIYTLLLCSFRGHHILRGGRVEWLKEKQCPAASTVRVSGCIWHDSNKEDLFCVASLGILTTTSLHVGCWA